MATPLCAFISKFLHSPLVVNWSILYKTRRAALLGRPCCFLFYDFFRNNNVGWVVIRIPSRVGSTRKCAKRVAGILPVFLCEEVGVYTMSQLPAAYGAGHIVSAVVTNVGKTVQTNVSATLNISGANTFTPAAVTIPTILPGDTMVVSFNSFTPTVVGENVVAVSVPDDDFIGNNTKVVAQSITTSTYSFAASASTAESAVKGSFVAACKYHVTGSARVVSVEAMILNNSVLSAQTTKAYVFNKAGVIVGQSNSFTTTAASLGKWVSFAITTPPTITDDYFYVGLDCSNSYFASYQTEIPMREGAYFKIPLGGGTPVDFESNSRLMFRANVSDVTGIETDDVNDVLIYSDTKVLFIDIPTLNTTAHLVVYSILGNQVYRTNDLSQGLTRIENNLQPGVYIVSLNVGDKVYTKRVVLQ